ALVISDYRAQGYRSLDRLQQLYGHLGTAFGGRRATAITGQKLIEYRDARLAEGAAPATVDLELRALARGFRLARKLHRVAVMPEFPELEGARIREGFFETADFEAVLRELPAHLALSVPARGVGRHGPAPPARAARPARADRARLAPDRGAEPGARGRPREDGDASDGPQDPDRVRSLRHRERGGPPGGPGEARR